MYVLKKAKLYSTGKFLERDLLFSTIVEDIGKNLDTKYSKIMVAEGMTVIPGFVDLHNHFNGAGGEGGPNTRSIPLNSSSLIGSGITTAVGLLGTDGFTRSLTDLLLQARKLKSDVDTFIYSGSYQVPGPTMTGSLAKDIILIPEVVGVKIALSDHRSSYPDRASLIRTVTETRVSSILAGKPGIIMTHMGTGKLRFEPIFDVVENTDIPITQFVPTHIDRNKELLTASVEFAKKGGFLDLTANIRGKTLESIRYLISKGVKIENITISTDGNGSFPSFDKDGRLLNIRIAPTDAILKIFVSLMKQGGDLLNYFMKAVSENPASRLKLKKGKIEKGYDADFLIFDDSLHLKYVVSRGKVHTI
ncbi:MAG: beta-aspartyl-peptidase [Thermoplasmatales archaeon]|jgi:beta-aspartyl-dipeptidase (metallo-type)|nr:beta-aspartyl-peptidase [Thermoplasmatales archaeon]